MRFLQYWSDFKNKLKNKITILNKRKGSTSKKDISPLSKLEKRALVILEAHFEKKKDRRNSEYANNAISVTIMFFHLILS